MDYFEHFDRFVDDSEFSELYALGVVVTSGMVLSDRDRRTLELVKAMRDLKNDRPTPEEEREYRRMSYLSPEDLFTEFTI